MPFYCVETPTITFDNLNDGDTIRRSNYTFEITYSQTQGEKVEALRFVLYDANNVELTSSSTYTSADVPPVSFTHAFYGFENDKEYKIRVEGSTIHGLTFSTSYYTFLVRYENPEEFVSFEVANMCTEGYNQIKSNLKYIEGVANHEPRYIDDTKIDLLDITFNKKVTFEDRELIPSDFVMQIWFGVGILGKLFKIYNADENMYFEGRFLREVPYGEIRTKDCVEIYGYIDGEEVFYKKSNYIELTNNTADLILYFKYNPTNNNYEVRLNEYNKVDNYINAGTIDAIYQEILTNTDRTIVNTSTIGNVGDISARHTGYISEPSTNVEFNRLTNIRYKKFEPYEASERKPTKKGDMTAGYPFTKLEIFNAIYDGIYITTDMGMQLTETMPNWGYDTCLRCLFENNLQGGNTNGIDLDNTRFFRVKSRVQGTFDWIVSYDIPFDRDNMKFVVNDYFAPSGVYMEYAFLCVYDEGVEGDYTIISTFTEWSKLFVTDINGDTLSLIGNVSFNTLTSNGSFGTLTPLASKYPIVINNSQNDFDSGTINGTILSDDINESLTFANRRQIIEKRNAWDKLLKNGHAKLIKDWNGFIWIARTISSPTYIPSSTMANGYGSLSFSFAEQGDWSSNQDIINNGFSEFLQSCVIMEQI